jgi:DNA-binding NarL/FixJ family response regulator
MPVMSGFEGARHIKYELPSTLILMVSQFDSAAFQREAIAAGSSGYVVKSNAASESTKMQVPRCGVMPTPCLNAIRESAVIRTP